MFNKINTLGGYFHEYQKSVSEPEKFWAQQADSFYWHKRWSHVAQWDFEKPTIHWFCNAKLNITENIFEKNLYTHGEQVAIDWEPNDPNEASRRYSYQQLFAAVNQVANGLKRQGIKKGDTVILYMPMVPELVIAVLACARIGAIHSVVFAGFSAQALGDRIVDAKAKIVLTANFGYRADKTIALKQIVDEALEKCDLVQRVVVYQRTEKTVPMKKDRDILWDEFIADTSTTCPAKILDSEDPLFILYTSGSTGQPKGIVHSTGGYMVYSAYTFANVFQYHSGDVYFCTADVGWITGHSYLVYGPLLNGAHIVMYEGVPTWPDAGRMWDIVGKYEVTHFYTAPTLIRALLTMGNEYLEDKVLSSLKVIGTVGEPINEDAWHWVHDHIGQNRCPVVDTWWQTETGGVMIAPIAGVTPTKPSFATLPLPGIQPVIINNDGEEQLGNSVEGNLCIRYPWPGMARSIWGDHERFKQTYFSQFKHCYFSGDGVRRDEDGYYRILGRVDDVINVSGHRLGTAEIENAINEHPLVNESAVVGYPHPIKGQGIYAFVVCPQTSTGGEAGIKQSIEQGVNKLIGPIAKPDLIQIVPNLPKTRSGKIMRRILRQIAAGDATSLGDTSTLLDEQIVEIIINEALVDVKR
ncbi:acetate--CoA ligase [Celerinatantimonas sp. MCCC 1A17872]|uniref:acetate--CoA ligase n=1 Tax=Celerinatantimonas sp. MCCC 1A17872 TaxID=3177514 RepID=UPI0038BF5399